MSAPGPVAGDNPYIGAYQTQQYDQGLAGSLPRGYGDESIFDSLADPPQEGLNAQWSPYHLFQENIDPPIGAGGVPEDDGEPPR